VAADDAIKLLLDNAAGIDDVGNESLSSSMSDDPVVLQLQFANALLFFAFDLPEKDALAVKSMKLNVSNVLTYVLLISKYLFSCNFPTKICL